MNTNKYNKVAVRLISFLIPLSTFLFISCANLDYTEETTRDEKWTFEYFEHRRLVRFLFDQWRDVGVTRDA